MIHAIAAEAAGLPILAVASRTIAHAAERAEQIGCRSVGFDELPGGADIVIVATPPALHAEHAIAALVAGATVLVEKPLATTLAQADAIVHAAHEAGGRMIYAENQAFAPVTGQALRLLADLGPLEYLDIRALSPRPTWGDFLTSGWGGGCLFDLGAHPIALALLAAGDDTPTSVSALLRSSADFEVDDHALVDLEFASGLHARIEVSWREATTTWDLQASSATGVVRAELLPVTGLEHNGEPVGLATAPLSVDEFVHDLGYLEQLQQTRDLIESTGAADMTSHSMAGRMDAEFGRHVLDVICGAYHSAGRAERGDAAVEPLPFAGRRDRTPFELWRIGD